MTKRTGIRQQERVEEIVNEYRSQRERNSEDLAVRQLAHALATSETAREAAEAIYFLPWWRRLRV